MSKKQYKTNHSQQDNLRSCTLPREDEGLRRPADIHNKTREHKLKPQYNPLISSLKNFVLAYEQGIKEGEQNIKDRIGNILSDEDVYSTDEDKIGKIWFIIEEQKIKGDDEK